MANKKRRCLQCKEYYNVDDGLILPVGFFHSQNCAFAYSVDARQKRYEKAKQLKAKESRKKQKLDKERVRPRSEWLSKLQSKVNQYVRLRDRNSGCISCDKPPEWSGQWHASHYYSRGHSSSLRFNLWNIHKSCSICNSHLSGNIGVYTPRLIEKIGRDRFDWLVENKSNIRSYDVEWIKRAIKITNKATKRLKKRLDRVD